MKPGPGSVEGPSGTELVYDAPVAEFRLSIVELAEGAATFEGGRGPEILLCMDRNAQVTRGGVTVELTRGRALFCAASEEPYALTGAGRVARATVGAVKREA